MTLINELTELKTIVENLRERVYTVADDPYLPNEEYIANVPYIPTELFNALEQKLQSINDDYSVGVINEALEYVNIDAPLGQYVNFDENDAQMEYIQENPDAYDEGLSAAQEQAASRAHEENSELWDDAVEDVRYLFESVFPRLF
jgi:hypothetical protein